jgi:hypothetical protein
MSLLVEHIDCLVTMDDERRVLRDAWLLVQGNTVAALGDSNQPTSPRPKRRRP